MSSAPMLIAGGGLGGLTAALALARAGIRCHVLEKADDFVELGAGLQLAPNATRVLADLGILDRVAEVAVFPRRLVLRDAVGGGNLTELDVSGCRISDAVAKRRTWNVAEPFAGTVIEFPFGKLKSTPGCPTTGS